MPPAIILILYSTDIWEDQSRALLHSLGRFNSLKVDFCEAFEGSDDIDTPDGDIDKSLSIHDSY